jgi:hypothetical protein
MEILSICISVKNTVKQWKTTLQTSVSNNFSGDKSNNFFYLQHINGIFFENRLFLQMFDI